MSWWLIEELELSVDCPAWCAENADVNANVDLSADGSVCLCLYHAAQAVEDGDVDPADLSTTEQMPCLSCWLRADRDDGGPHPVVADVADKQETGESGRHAPESAFDHRGGSGSGSAGRTVRGGRGGPPLRPGRGAERTDG